MTHEEKARAYFLEGYNCSQAVVLAFADEVGLPADVLAKLASSFGGGMGRMREVCGAVSGMFMVAGLLHGYDDPKAGTEKAAHYALIQQLAAEFKQELGCHSIICRELLGVEGNSTAPTPAARTAEYYRKRPCVDLVGAAAKVMAAHLPLHAK